MVAVLGLSVQPADAIRLDEALSPWLNKMDGALRTHAGQRHEALLVLQEQADLSGAAVQPTKQLKGRFVHTRLTEVARRTQADLLAQLEADGIEYRSFWITNMVWVSATSDQLARLAKRADIARIEEDTRFDIPNLRDEVAPEPPHTASAVEWNVARVRAPEVWGLGITGTGAVVGSMDTGFEWTHPALLQQYRGWVRGMPDHDYNWHDAIHVATGPCGADSPEPCDEDSHGTLTMGTSVGDGGFGNQIGVAPGAQWIGCRCWERTRRTHRSYVTECFEWFVAPTDIHGANANPDRAPHVINNSWICEWDEGCTDPLSLLQVVENVRAAGIVVVASAGNSGGLGCETIYDPPAMYDAAFTVGSTDAGDRISAFSSTGPVSRDGSMRAKPDIVAPGENVRSCVLNGSYKGGLSGTSLAGPIVAGTVALMISAVPSLAGDVDAIERILIETARPLTTEGECGGRSNQAHPNHVFGWGIVDAFAAVQRARQLETSVDDEQQPNDGAGQQAVLRFRLHPNRPNPFNPTTQLRYDVARTAQVQLRVHDAVGRVVRTLVPGLRQPPGEYLVTWDGRADTGSTVSSGVYFARLLADGRVIAYQRLTLVR